MTQRQAVSVTVSERGQGAVNVSRRAAVFPLRRARMSLRFCGSGLTSFLVSTVALAQFVVGVPGVLASPAPSAALRAELVAQLHAYIGQYRALPEMSATKKEIKVAGIALVNADDTNVYVKFAVKIREKVGGAVLYTLDGSARGNFRLGQVTSDKVCIAAPPGSYTALTVTSMDIPRVSGQEADLARRAIAANFPPNLCVPLYPTITIADAHGEECVCPPGKNFLRGNIARFRVTLSNLSARTVTVRYATADGSARAGTDYGAASGNLNIPSMSAFGEILVPLRCREGTQGNRRFTVNLSNPVNGLLLRTQAQGLIIDYPEGEPCGP